MTATLVTNLRESVLKNKEGFDVLGMADSLGICTKAIMVRNAFLTVIQDADDFIRFLKFWELEKFRSNMLYDAVCSLHSLKLEQNDITFEDFESLYKIDKMVALEKLFQQKVVDNDLKRLEKLDVTAKDIYNISKKEHGTLLNTLLNMPVWFL